MAQLKVVNPEPVRSGAAVLSPEREVPTLLQAPSSPGPWGVLVIVHGLGVGPERYDHLAKLGLEAGLIVLRPSIPQEDPARGFPLDRSVLGGAEPRDLTAVLDALRSSAYGRHVDWSRVTVLGHSDGADAALELGFNPLVMDRRVGRVVAMEADPLDFTPVRNGPWLLVVHADTDELVPYADGLAVFSAMSGTRTCMATVLGGTHTDAAWGEGDPPGAAADALIAELLAARPPYPSRCPRGATPSSLVSLVPAP